MAARADPGAKLELNGGGVLSIDLQLILLFIYGKNLLIDTEFVFCVSAWAPMELNIAPLLRLSRPVLEKNQTRSNPTRYVFIDGTTQNLA